MKEESEMDKHITVPMKKETVATLKAGDYVYLTGTVYTARDAAHKRMYEILQEGGELHRQEKDAQLARQDRRQQAEWINTHLSSWILGLVL